ncbi:hypothetical protein BGW36DRAFT_290093 [Talaromyces proteolyticus]|uniref:Uncharacterized protein n=1 Tax=Talaromyces proteolyticus TaxID=1131652 RepID=A0AAD4KYB9_9EURO|nr:uncharacterized protein BGW36DRAFT_290093 [Talaromyces proteolyticus]KAH8701792.1 hypothetical protein BGW36DRAFT_290093 [Talaromyces proteolyticus]
MIGLPVLIAVAVGGSSLLIVAAILGVVVWWRMRQDRLSLAMAQARHATSHHGQVCSSFVTESPIESPLATYPYPYMRHEYIPVGSQETLQPSISQVRNSPPPTLKKEKSKSIRRSISKSLSKSLSIGKSSQKQVHPEPIPVSPLNETFPMPFPNAKEKEPKSAIAGLSELPTEITPRNTPEREKHDIIQLEMLNSRPGSTAWPLLQPDRISSVAGGQPALLNRYPTRIRSGSITAQTAGTAPEMPMPPLPMGPTQPYQLSREDSLMGMSSLSLETANSSILDDGLQRSMSMDGEHNTSPSLPPCPTFTPFSPYDIVIGGSVARNCAAQRRSQSQRLSSSTARLTYVSTDSYKGDSDDRHSPRRSLTTREVSPQSSEWASELPRRSETVISSSSLGRSSSRPLSSVSGASPKTYYSTTGQGLYSSQEFGTQSNRQGRYSMYETQQGREEHMANFSKSVGDRPKSSLTQSPRGVKDSPGKGPLPSALKSAQGMRKGHRRQNCVRISIHPPITFGGPAFSPMLEEPEEVLDLDNDLTAPKSRSESASLLATKTNSSHDGPVQKHARHRSTGSIPGEPSILSNSPSINSRIPRPSTSRKRPHSRTNSADDVFMSENRIIIPEPSSEAIVEENHTLSSTPSPEKHHPLWSLPHSNEFAGSSPIFPTNASTGSPRRPGPKGPRIQPIKAQRNTVPSPSTSQAIDNGVYMFTAGGPSGDESPTSKLKGRSLALVASPTRDVRKSITLLRRMNSDAWDDESKQYRRMGRNTSINKPRGNKFTTPPSSNRNSLLSNDSLTIWEDASEDDKFTPPPERRKKHPFKTLERIDSEGTTEEYLNPTTSSDSSRQSTIRQVPPSSSIITFGDHDREAKANSDSSDEHVHKPAKRVAVMATPNKNQGYGSVAVTPGSLYDGDGFLKE